MIHKFDKYDLVILVELGYISFERWMEIFHVPVITVVIVDHITRKSTSST